MENLIAMPEVKNKIENYSKESGIPAYNYKIPRIVYVDIDAIKP